MNKRLAPLITCVSIALTGCQAVPQSASPEFPAGAIVDMSYAFNADTVYWPTAAGFKKTTDFNGMAEAGYYYSSYSISTSEHGGTHLDAPVHFSEGKNSTDQIPLERLLGPAIVIDVHAQSMANRDYQVSTGDIANWEAEFGVIPDGSIVLFRTGFGQYWPDREAYMGTAERGEAAVAKLHFPGIHPDTANFLVTERSVKSVGIDTPSIDFGQSSLYETHRVLLGANIPAFENIANLDRLPVTGAFIIALPMKIEGGSGGPLRIIALLP
jgi:kynurenine formamidase